jgi:hypothetical protein
MPNTRPHIERSVLTVDSWCGVAVVSEHEGWRKGDCGAGDAGYGEFLGVVRAEGWGDDDLVAD